jgi:hypothetical protein
MKVFISQEVHKGKETKEKRDVHKIINFPGRYAKTTGDNLLLKGRHEGEQVRR